MDSVTELRTDRAVFFDRDGTINRDPGYVHRPEDLVLFPGVPEAIARLNAERVPVIVVTNQGGVGLGLYTEADVLVLHGYLQEEIAAKGAHVDAFYYCPFHPRAVVDRYLSDNAWCRKPNPGMLDEGIERFSLRDADCWMVGDRESDAIVGASRNMTTVLVRTGHGLGEAPTTTANHIADDLPAAVDLILRTWNTTR